MPSPPLGSLNQIIRQLKSLELLLVELLQQQRQQDQLKVLVELLSLFKQQSIAQYQQEEWLDSYELMRLFRISRSTLQRWKKRALIHPTTIGNRDYFLRRDIERLLNRGEC